MGDYVNYNKDENVIESVYVRKNENIRPPVANIDKMFIVVAPVPAPDFMLVDKLLVQCGMNNIKPIIVINKTDLCDDAFIANVKKQYKAAAKIYQTTTKDSSTVERLKDEMKNNLCIFAGQSAVGKSSIINTLLPTALRMVGDISVRNNRGKNCTRESQIYLMPNNAKIADTTGFSALELKNVSKEKLNDYYTEIKNYSTKCAYNTCNHYKEKEEICAVKQAVVDGKISKERYSRYVALYEELKNLEDKKYG